MPILVIGSARALFGPVVVPVPHGAQADRLWDLCVAYNSMDGLFELKTPKTDADLAMIATAFEPYLRARQWETIERPAP